ncbi:MAG: TIGR01777 family oxidoreductase [Undibacterium sp.]|nr:TIGR01777 family oxidoreductase [Undibacterium sp.]
MAVQGILGAFDTIYHHELSEALPQRMNARLELSIHAIRSLLYSLLFIGLAGWQWNGVFAVLLVCLLGIEIVLTLWDFVVEDRTRLLPATERITHTILAMNGGAFVCLLILNIPLWLSASTELVFVWHGGLSWFLVLCGVGVGMSGLRDSFAARALARFATSEEQKSLEQVHFSDHAEHVLITGATGFVGQNLIKALLKNGQQVTVLTRDAKRAAWIFGGGLRCISSLDELPSKQKIDVVINLAGARILGWRWTQKRQAVLLKSRVETTKNIVSWIARTEQPPRLLLSASAIGYYGIQEQNATETLNENSPAQAIFMSQLCQEWEAAAHAAKAYGVVVACMRFGLVLGQQGALPMLLLPIKLGLGGALGGGRQVISWIHVHDVIRGIAHLWHLSPTGGEGAYNFTAPQALTQAQFSQTAAAILHRPYWIPTPGFPMRLVLGEQADLLLEGQRVYPERLLGQGWTFTYPDLKSALLSLV